MATPTHLTEELVTKYRRVAKMVPLEDVRVNMKLDGIYEEETDAFLSNPFGYKCTTVSETLPFQETGKEELNTKVP